MAGFYYIKIANGLLEPKHYKAMGEAVWLYMWLQDKCTSVNENGDGKVLGNKPIVYETDIKPVLECSRSTYSRMVNRLRDGGYISTIRTPSGLCIIIHKTKKYQKKGSVKIGNHKRSNSDVSKSGITGSDVSKSDIDVSKSTNDVSKSGIQYKTTQDYTETIQITGDKSPDVVSSLYYQVIKKYALPVRNHNNVKAAIKKLASEVSTEDAEVYLRFLLDKYQSLQFSHKPELNEALDIQAKRLSIINAVKRAATEQRKGTIKI